MRKSFFLLSILMFLVTASLNDGVFGLFTSGATSQGNTFVAAAAFQTPTPTPTATPTSTPTSIPTVTPTSTPTSSPSTEPTSTPSTTPSPTPSSTPSPTPNPDSQFPICPKEPGASVNDKKWDVGYDEGLHWIVANGLKFGSDYVYFLGPDDDKKTKVLQCYYPLPRDGTAIQTNWLKKKTEIPPMQTWLNGADFGLNPGPYLFQNIDFSTL